MKKVLITGASSGLGQALAHAFQNNGDQVLTLSRRGQSIPEAVNISLNLLDEDGIATFIHHFKTLHSKLDILINNAGISPSGRILNFSEADFDKTVAVNFKACRQLTEGLRPILSGGLVVNIVSRVGIEGRTGLCGYAAAKGLLSGYTIGMAEELKKDNIRIVGINPGFMRTEMVDEKAIEMQKRESVLSATSTVERSASLILALVSQPIASGQLINLDSRIYHSWNH